MAGWPAAGGEDAVDPSVSDYLANMNTWIVCGPFVLSQKENFMVQFASWLEVNDSEGDGFDFGVANHREGPYQWWGMPTSGEWDWTIFDVWLTDWAGDDLVFVAWQFWSDGDGNRAEGAWLDELRIWRYDMPAATCGDVDPGNKGVALDAYDPTTGGAEPMIRSGETIAVGDLVAADARWVRMVFEQKNGAVDLLAYDRMVDTLCANEISVLGILNHQTLFRQDVNEPATAEDYRQEFAGAASFIAEHFQGRISYWEVWNEENYDPVDNGQPDMPRVDPLYYAPLLETAYGAIRNANPAAQVLFGGLGSAWDNSLDYLEAVYNEWNSSGPFDHFAIHPYFDDTHGLDPAIYMHADPGYDTILDKFMETMHGRGDGSKKTWVTEVGWTSSDGDPNAACLAPVDVTAEQQKAYLKTGFDILFNEVDLWGSPWVRAVDKAFWYQYMDVGLSYEEACPGGAAGGMSWKGYVPAGGLPAGVTGQSSGLPDVPWWFGLYQGLKRTPKPVQCAFMAYPRECQQVFLPLTLKNH